jgi:subtilisin family serine protease
MRAPTRRALAALLALLLALAAAPAPPLATAQAGALAATPGALDATIPLGGAADLSLTLANGGAAALAPRLFEAYPASGPRPAATAPALRAPLPQQPARVDPRIGQALAASPDGRADLLVFLADQADLSAASAVRDWDARGALVFRTLRDHAEATQRDLRAALAARGLDYTPLWVVNAVAVRGSAADVAALAARAEVAELRANRTAALDAPPAQVVSATCNPDAANVCWNIARIGASRVWSDFGARGEGVVVANIDSGVRFDHPALIGQYRGNSGGAIDHSYSWFDIFGDSPFPVDSGDHGTHTMGTMVARGATAAEPAVGVAPGARWVAVRACGARECSERDLLLAAQWVLAPTDLAGNNPRPELRPHVVNNSWTSGKDSSWYAGYTAAWRAAGIYPVFAAGNTGNGAGCATVQSPGDYADVTAVGALDSADRLTSFSSIGPGPGGRAKPDLTAPGNGVWSTVAGDGRPYASSSGTSMAAPHVAGAVALLLSANPDLIGDYDGVYAALAGAATPLAPDSRFLDQLHSACPPVGTPNNIYGYGRLDAYGAVARASVDIPWLQLDPGPLAAIAPGSAAQLRVTVDARRVPGPGRYEARVLVHGAALTDPPLVVPVALTVPADPSHATLSGRVTRAADGAPIAATVSVAGGATARADAQGRYTLTLPAATAPYTLTADARDYVASSAALTLAPGEQASLDFALAPDLPRLTLDPPAMAAALRLGQQAPLTLALGNQGSRALTYSVSLPAELFGVWRSDEPDGPPPAWTAPPPGATTILIADDGVSEPIPLGFAFPFAGASYSQIYVLANGVIAFAPPAGAAPFARTCLPGADTPGAAIAPLRVDLDPSAAGARLSYAAAEGGVLVSWEQVPLFSDPAKRLSFQALLLPDGRVSLRYRDVVTPPVGEGASYGVQFQGREAQSLGCAAELGLRDGLTVELRPQPAPGLWLKLDQAGGQVPPGAAATLALTARWAPPNAGGWPLSGAVLITTNDPLRPRARVTVRLTPAPAPNRLVLPLAGNRGR